MRSDASLTGNWYLNKYYQQYSKCTKCSTNMINVLIGLEDQKDFIKKYSVN